MSRPSLLILSFSDISADARVLKQVRLFAESYEVTTCGYGPPPHPDVDHVRIPDDASATYRTRRGMILGDYSRMYWSTPAVISAQGLLAARPRFDIVLANDIETVGLAESLEPAGGVHADIHEYAPRQSEELPVWRWFVAPYVRWMCRRFLPRASSMTTVGEGIAREYLRRFGVTAGVVTNAAPYAEGRVHPAGRPIRLVHSGAALRNRDLHVCMEAVAQSSADVSLDLFLMPNDPGYLAELRQLAETSDRLHVHEPVPYASLIETLSGYDVGIHVMPPRNFNNRWALPNKFFDYVQARLGLIIGPSPEMATILERHRLGAVTSGFSGDDIRRVLDGLTPESVTAWKAHADAAAIELSSERQVDGWRRAIDALRDTLPGRS